MQKMYELIHHSLNYQWGHYRHSSTQACIVVICGKGFGFQNISHYIYMFQIWWFHSEILISINLDFISDNYSLNLPNTYQILYVIFFICIDTCNNSNKSYISIYVQNCVDFREWDSLIFCLPYRPVRLNMTDLCDIGISIGDVFKRKKVRRVSDTIEARWCLYMSVI